MALVPRPAPEGTREHDPTGDLGAIRRPHWVAWIFVVLSVAAQCLVLALVWDYRHNDPNCGESCAYAGMGLVAIMSGAAWFVLPGLVATVWLLWDTLKQRRLHGGRTGRLVLLGAALALTPVLMTQLLLSDRKISRTAIAPTEPAITRGQQRKTDELEGYAWASDNGVTKAADCSIGNPVFQGGCKKFAYAHGDTLPDGRANGGVIRMGP